MSEPVTLLARPSREVFPGFHGRFVHTDAMTLAFWDIDAGAAVPPHSHPHEQVVRVEAGELDLTVDGIVYRLHPGQVYAIPGGVEHAASAVTDARVLDIFAPVRDDYRFD